MEDRVREEDSDGTTQSGTESNVNNTEEEEKWQDRLGSDKGGENCKGYSGDEEQSDERQQEYETRRARTERHQK